MSAPTPATIWHGAILAEIDTWAAANNHCMMTIGPDRSRPILELMQTSQPQIMAELGGYIGYSAILFGDELRRAGGRRYYSLEASAEYAAVARSLVDLAGLGEFVEILVGEAADSLVELVGRPEHKKPGPIDLLFLDHDGCLYPPDFLTVERLGLLAVGSTVMADNAWLFGAEEYAGWMTVPREQEVQGRRVKYESRTLPYVLPDGQQVSFGAS
ncbi:hypothetical protein NYO67_4722 [Aspergillus flavus]|nr:hypothetical protein NYO67_4722 [Aspergillus flavus]